MYPSESQVYVRHNPYTRVRTLGFDVRDDTDSLRVAWTCTLMELFEHERDLDRGRFDRFVWPTQENVVSLRIHHKTLPWMGNITKRVEWIAERVDTPWSLTLSVHDVQEATFHFSFADLGAAMMFKLVYA